MKKSLIAALAVLALGGCTTANISEPSVCDTESITFPTPAVPTIPTQYQNVADCSGFSLTVPSESTTTTVNLSSSLQKLSDVAKNLSVNITALTLDNTNEELSWINSVSVSVSSPNLPSKLFASYVVPSTGAEHSIDVKVVMSGADAYTYLNSGPITLTITLGSATLSACQAVAIVNQGAITSDVHICAAASGTVSKSL